jgi:hypothetical protein
VREQEYRRRLELSYPIHPELFDRLYKDWSTLDRFQRTRGVLRLMATVISVLWQRGDQNLLILPGTIPMDDQRVSSELTKYLEDGWDPIIRTDIDGTNSLPLRLDADHKNLGRYSATRRVARAVYLASAPREEGRRGIDIKTITLGTVQPGEAPGTFADALRHLSNNATFLYVDGNQYWYSLRANITRLAADRAASNVTEHDADDEMKRRLQSMRERGPFAALHAFPDGPGDISDDDDGVHLVLLPLTHHHVPNGQGTPAIDLAEQILTQRNAGPRLNRNMLVFCAASEARLTELRQGVRMHLAWKSIVADEQALQLTPNDLRQATTKVAETDEIVKQRIFETFQHILVPEQTPGTREIRWHQTKPSGTGPLAERIAKKLESEERLITRYGGTRVRMDLDRIPLWSERQDIAVDALWKAYSQFPYLPRLASFDVLAHAISDGVAKTDWAAETFAYADAHENMRWVGLQVGQHLSVARSGLLVHPAPAVDQLEQKAPPNGGGIGRNGGDDDGDDDGTRPPPPPPPPAAGTQPTKYYARFDLSTVRAIRQLQDILANVVDHLSKADDGNVTLTLEINGTSSGYGDGTVRAVRETAGHYGARANEFER